MAPQSARVQACAHCPAHADKFRMRACGRNAAAGDRETEGQRDRETETERQGDREAEGCGLPIAAAHHSSPSLKFVPIIEICAPTRF